MTRQHGSKIIAFFAHRPPRLRDFFRDVYADYVGEKNVKISVAHNRPVQEVKGAVDRSFDDIFKAAVSLPVEFAQEQRTWEGNKLSFSVTATIGFMSTPIKGTVEVTDHDIIIDADLGMWERLIPEDKVRDAISDRVKGLLN